MPKWETDKQVFDDETHLHDIKKDMSSFWTVIGWSIVAAAIFLGILYKANEGNIGKYSNENKKFDEDYKRKVAEQEAAAQQKK